MKTFLDSSSFAKRFVEEPGSGEVDEICRSASELALCVICALEIVSALNRRVRERSLTAGQYNQAKTRLSEDIRDAVILNPTPAVVSRAIALLESNTLRAIDALHVACALEWEADLFISSDKRQTTAANKAGLRTRFIG